MLRLETRILGVFLLAVLLITVCGIAYGIYLYSPLLLKIIVVLGLAGFVLLLLAVGVRFIRDYSLSN